jgi:hypothetical protein
MAVERRQFARADVAAALRAHIDAVPLARSLELIGLTCWSRFAGDTLRTTQRRIAAGTLPKTVHYGRRSYFRLDDLVQFLEDSRLTKGALVLESRRPAKARKPRASRKPPARSLPASREVR